MKKLLQRIFPNLFQPDIHGKRAIDESKNKENLNTLKDDEYRLEKGKQISIFLLEIDGHNNFKVKRWCFQEGSALKRGEIVGVLENEIMSMEFESFYHGKIIYICEKNVFLNKEEILFKIEGI